MTVPVPLASAVFHVTLIPCRDAICVEDTHHVPHGNATHRRRWRPAGALWPLLSAPRAAPPRLPRDRCGAHCPTTTHGTPSRPTTATRERERAWCPPDQGVIPNTEERRTAVEGSSGRVDRRLADQNPARQPARSLVAPQCGASRDDSEERIDRFPAPAGLGAGRRVGYSPRSRAAGELAPPAD